MQPQQQQAVIATGVHQQTVIQPQQQYVVRTPGPFNDKQASVIGVLLIIIGCLSILFNAVDLAVGTGMTRYYQSYSYYYNYKDNTLSHASLGVAGHGFWCGVLVSRLHTWLHTPTAYTGLLYTSKNLVKVMSSVNLYSAFT